MSTPAFIFSKNGPFHRIVGASMVSLAGCPCLFHKENLAGFKPEHEILLEGFVVEDQKIRPYEIRELVHAGHISQSDFFGSVFMMLIITAYETVKDDSDQSPEFEFFRHVRNASADKNEFIFEKQEPSRPAHWRGIVIDHTLKTKNNPFHKKGCWGNILGVADGVQLLSDIEPIVIKRQQRRKLKLALRRK